MQRYHQEDQCDENKFVIMVIHYTTEIDPSQSSAGSLKSLFVTTIAQAALYFADVCKELLVAQSSRGNKKVLQF